MKLLYICKTHEFEEVESIFNNKEPGFLTTEDVLYLISHPRKKKIKVRGIWYGIPQDLYDGIHSRDKETYHKSFKALWKLAKDI